MDNATRTKYSYELFNDLNCCSENLNGNYSDTALAFVLEDMMRCLILNCLAALSVIQMERMKEQEVKSNAYKKREILKRKLFRAACLMMMDTEFDNDEVVTTTVLSTFPDKSNISDERSWLPLHFAVAAYVQNEISAEDVYVLHTIDLLAMHRLSRNVLRDDDDAIIGCTPAHLLCMQKKPDMAIVRYFCLRDLKAFLLCDQRGRCTLHLAAQYSESVELLQVILQVDQTMTKNHYPYSSDKIRPLGSLCRRLEFPTFQEMFSCLVAVDNSAELVCDAVIQCLNSYRNSRSEDYIMHPGSRGEATVICLEILLNMTADSFVNYDSYKIFKAACSNLRGELGVAVLSLLLRRDGSLIERVDSHGWMAIHHVAFSSSLDILRFLHINNPESLSVLKNDRSSLLHLALDGTFRSRDKVQYLCDQCPALIHQVNDRGFAPIHRCFSFGGAPDIRSIVCLCNADEAVVRDKFTPSNINHAHFGWLPLHFLIDEHSSTMTELSDEADCFRLFLRLYPASAGIKYGDSRSPYDLAVACDMSTYFIRLMLSADPTIDPIKSRDLNFAARRDGMFLAFRALSADLDSMIWAKLRFNDKNLLSRVISYL